MDTIFGQKLFEKDNPNNEDLEYSPVFAEFTALATPREEHQIGEHIVPAQAPGWGEVFKMGCALLERSRDLRILVKVCHAALHQHGLPGLAQGLSLMARWVEGNWDDLYPKLHVEGDYDPLLRSNAIAEISDPEALVRSLRQAVFLETPVGSITISAVEHLLNGKQSKGQTFVSSLDQLSRIIIVEGAKNQDRFVAIASIHSFLTTIASVFKNRLEPDYWPNIELLTDIIARLEHFISTQLGKKIVTQPEQPVVTPVASQVSSASVAVTTKPIESAPYSPFVELSTRTEAIKALASAREYFENNEPSHPAPILIRRIERLVGLDFLTIIKDLVPESLQQVQTLAGDTRE
ncbi:MAG: type VI secretion system protein TssA [Oscillospiraceae bacterium]|nr:type VI secretion system protein TssA [Oscillospiraceae bacterium]